MPDQAKDKILLLLPVAKGMVTRKEKSPAQMNEFLEALSKFCSKSDAEEEPYPGLDGNRCLAKGCGAMVDASRICICGWDHNDQIKLR